jgi:hypothetical protein
MRTACAFLLFFPFLAVGAGAAVQIHGDRRSNDPSFPERDIREHQPPYLVASRLCVSRECLAQKYSVLYMLDGQILFDDCRGGISEWHVPDLFTLGLLESPSLAAGNGQLLCDTEHLFKGPPRVYIGMGGRESGGSADSAENLGMSRWLTRAAGVPGPTASRESYRSPGRDAPARDRF